MDGVWLTLPLPWVLQWDLPGDPVHELLAGEVWMEREGKVRGRFIFITAESQPQHAAVGVSYPIRHLRYGNVPVPQDLFYPQGPV